MTSHLKFARRDAARCARGAGAGGAQHFRDEPEWGALAKSSAATRSRSTPRPTRCRIRTASRPAEPDRTCAQRRSRRRTGAELEVGWLPLVLQQAGNPKIQPGKPGYFEAARYVPCSKCRCGSTAPKAMCIRAATRISRPTRATSRKVAGPLAERLAELDPDNAAVLSGAPQGVFRALERGDGALGKAGRAAEGHADRRAAQGVHYLEAWLGLKRGRGTRTQARHRADHRASDGSAGDVAAHPVKMVIRAAYQSDRASQWIAERAKITPVMLPFTVGGDDRGEGSFQPVRRHDRASAQGGAVNSPPAEFSILLPAFVAGLLVTATHVPLGTQVLARGIVFIDLAIAQIAGCGVLLADSARFRAAGSGGAGRRARGGACRRAAAHMDRAHLARCAGGRDRRRRSCSAQPAASCCSRATCTAASTCRICWSGRSCGCSRRACVGRGVYAVDPRAVVRCGERLGRVGFYLLFAVAVTVSVQLVGLYLVFATLIVPPLATRHMTRRTACCGVAAGLDGLRGRACCVHRARSAERSGNRLGAGGACAGMARGNATTSLRRCIDRLMTYHRKAKTVRKKPKDFMRPLAAVITALCVTGSWSSAPRFHAISYCTCCDHRDCRLRDGCRARV